MRLGVRAFSFFGSSLEDWVKSYHRLIRSFIPSLFIYHSAGCRGQDMVPDLTKFPVWWGEEGQTQGAGGTEERPLSWALEVRGFLGEDDI